MSQKISNSAGGTGERAVTFAVGDITLEGLLSLPADPATTAAVVCHPHPLFGGNMQNNVVKALVETLGSAGLATLRFNFRGVGGSGGAHGGGQAERADVAGAIDYLLSRVTTVSQVVLVGYSFGAMVSLYAGAEDPRVRAIVGVATPVERIEPTALKQAAKPMLFVSGDSDHISPLDGLRALLDQLDDPKQLVLLPGVDHFFRGREAEAAQIVLKFVESLAETKIP